MKTSEAINRLRYTVANGNRCNANDIIAMNALLEYLNKIEQKTIQDNLLFAKLYTHTLKELVTECLDIDFANMHLNKILDTHLDILIQELHSRMEMASIENFFKNKGIQRIDTPNAFEVAQYLIKHNKKCFENIDINELPKVEISDIKETLVAQINLSLQNFKNV